MMERSTRVAVTGLGAVTPLGLTAGDFWKAMMRSESGAGPITRFDPTPFKTRFACELKGFDASNYMDRKQAARYEPFCQYGMAAAREAMADAKLDPSALTQSERDRIGIVFGSGIGGIEFLERQARVLSESGPDRISPFLVPMMIMNQVAGLLAMEFGVKGPNHAVVTACATGNHSIGDALLLLRTGQADAILAGGTEAPITPLALGGFSAMRALSTRNDCPRTASRPFDRDRDGFVAGEGAGALVLETFEHARARGARIYAEVIGFGASADAYHFAAPDPEGYGVSLAMRRALADGGLQPDDVDHLNMHATSTPLGDEAETRAVKLVFGEHAYRMSLSATKSMTGHLLGAAGAIEAVAAILAIQHGRVPPTINVENLDPACDLDYTLNAPRDRKVDVALSNAFGFGGHNTTVAFRRVEA